MMNKPIKRHIALQPISREHHFALLLCWKIREGLKRQIAPERMKAYTDWFWTNYLNPHFSFEEKYIFSLLSRKHKFIRRVLREHGRLRSLFTNNDKEKIERNLYLIEEELIAHIRFEERILFKEIEKKASAEQLKQIEEGHSQNLILEDWQDEFWV